MLIKPMKYQQIQDQVSPNSKLLIQALLWKPSKTNEITTFLRLSSPGIIMCYHLFCCLAPWNLQDCPRASKLPQDLPHMSPGASNGCYATPTPPPDVPRCPNMCPGNPKTSPRRPQALSKSSLKVPNHSKMMHIPSTSHQLAPTDHGQQSKVIGPRSEVQSSWQGRRAPEGFAIIVLGSWSVASFHESDVFVVHVGEVREAEEMRCCSQLTLSLWFLTQM